MNAAILVVRAVFLIALALAIVAGLSELQIWGSGKLLGADPLQVMLWAMIIAPFTSPITVSFASHRHSQTTERDDRDAER